MINGYTEEQIANELVSTALNEAYYGNSLYVAKSIPVIDDYDKSVLDAYLTGRKDNIENPHIRLQEIAMKIRTMKV